MRREGGMDICLPETRSVFASGVYWGHLDHLPKLNQAPARRPCALASTASARVRTWVRGLGTSLVARKTLPVRSRRNSAVGLRRSRAPDPHSSPVHCLVYPPILESSHALRFTSQKHPTMRRRIGMCYHTMRKPSEGSGDTAHLWDIQTFPNSLVLHA